MGIWDKGTTKVQFPSIVIDQNGMSAGKIWPDIRTAYPPEQIRSELLRSYATSSPSGNAFDIAFLRKLFPVPEAFVGFDSIDQEIKRDSFVLNGLRKLT